MQKNTPEQDIIHGTIWKQLLIFFFPILIGTFFQQLYNTVDAVILGQFAGKEALSSVGGSAGQIISLIVEFFTGLSAGCAVIFSQYFGADKQKSIQKALHTAYAFSLCGGIILGVAGIVTAPAMLRMMHTPQSLLADSILYLRIYFAGLIFVFIFNMGSSILRAIGDSRRPLYYLMICCLINILLDMFFVIYLHAGIAGVASATLLSQLVSSVLVTRAVMHRERAPKLYLSQIRTDMPVLVTMLKIGLPTGIQASMYGVSNIIVQTILNGFGVDTMAAWTAYGKIDAIFWMINGAFGISVCTFSGLNYGAGQWHRIRKGTRICLAMGLSTAALFSLFLYFKSGLLFRIFTQDASVINIGVHMVRVIAPAYCLYTFIEIFSGSLRAIGVVNVPALIILLGACLLRIIWVITTAPAGNLARIIFCYPVTWGCCAAAMTLCYLRHFCFRRRTD